KSHPKLFGKNCVFLNWFLKASFFLTTLGHFVFLNRFLKASFFLIALENFAFLNLLYLSTSARHKPAATRGI
ncbi:MAG: hypothetical protein RR752_06650, partial [Mucinivorans sp.]